MKDREYLIMLGLIGLVAAVQIGHARMLGKLRTDVEFGLIAAQETEHLS